MKDLKNFIKTTMREFLLKESKIIPNINKFGSINLYIVNMKKI